MSQMLEEYFEEINWPLSMRNLDNLIRSHRAMRETIRTLNEQVNKTSQELYEEYKTSFELRVRGNYISIDKLSKMTVQEFADYLAIGE